MSPKRDYFNYVQMIFTKSGYLPRGKSIRSYILKFLLTPVISILVLLVIYDFRYMHRNIFEIATVFESLSSHGHVLGRKLSILRHSSLLEEILKDTSSFWKYDKFGEKLGDVFRRKMSLRDLFVKVFHAVIFIINSYFYLTPVFAESVDLPQACWIPGGNKYARMVIYALQVICLSESPIVVGIMDGTFLLMCGEMEIQFHLLKKTVNSIKIGSNSEEKHEEDCFSKLKMCSSYHNFLLREHVKMKTAFSEFFLLQFMVTIEGLCIEIFVVNKAQTWGQFVLAAIYLYAIVMQICFTFISASNVEIEAETLADDIYKVDWYNATNSKIPKHIRFMLMKAQEPLRLTGAGLFDVNRSTLLQILRTGFSISAIIRQI